MNPAVELLLSFRCVALLYALSAIQQGQNISMNICRRVKHN